MKHSELEQLVIDFVSRPNYRPAKSGVIAKRLNLPKESHQELKKVVKGLVRKGRLNYGSKHLVQPPGAVDSSQLTGTFQRAAGGFGFVRPGSSAAPTAKRQDIYIPARKTLDAATGDVVLVRLKRSDRGPNQRQVGEITQIIERETHQFVGTYLMDAGSSYVRVDGDLFSQPILVGDPGAKRVRPEDKVVIEMVRFPSHAHCGEAVITEVLGDRAAPGVDTLLVLRQFELPEQFPEEVLDDSRRQAELFDGRIDDNRVDLTHLTIVTIDPEDARDYDDAISLERNENGHWRLGVHIADVSCFVPPNSHLDREARHRATSVYLPDRVVPMLPEVLSNNLASLQPDRIRYTKTVFIEMTAEGVRVSTEFCSAAIKSRRRFTYEEVDDFLRNREAWKKKLKPPIHGLLGDMHQLAMLLRGRRLHRGAIELNLPEIKLELDDQGQVHGACRVEHTESHQIIEEFMLTANEAVAEMLRDRQLLFLRRIHENPDPRKLKALTDFVRELQIPAESLESRFEIKRVLAEVTDRPERDAVNYAVLRSMQKAVYSPKQEGHYALASDCYCHFTSPIRRYPDLTIHRMLEALAGGLKPASDFGALLALGEHCSDREQRAEAAERELTKLKLLNYLSKRIGQQMDGVISGVQSFGLFVQGLELPAEGLVHVTSLSDDYYDYDAATHTLAGRREDHRYRLGDAVRVEIVHVDLDRRELDFRLVEKLRSKKPRGKTERSTKARRSGSQHGAGDRRGSKKRRARPDRGTGGVRNTTPAKTRSRRSSRRPK